MAVVLADVVVVVVVVVKRCRTPCPYISLYTTVPLVLPRCIYIHINISPFSPSSFLPLIRDSSEYTTQQPSTHQTAYTYKRQTFTATCLKYSSTINPSRSIKQPQNIIRPPPPHFGSLAQIISRNTQTKNKMQGGRAEFKKTSRVQCMPPPRGVSAKQKTECNPGFTVV